MIRVGLAHDALSARELTHRLLATGGGIEVVGQAHDAHNALRLARQLQPHVFIVDHAIRGISGLELAALVHAELPEIGVVLLTDDPIARVRAPLCGVRRCLPRDAGRAELLHAIHDAHRLN